MKWKQRASLVIVCIFILWAYHYHSKTGILEYIDYSKRYSNEEYLNDINPWDIWAEMPNDKAITSMSDLQINIILNAMTKSKIINADVGIKGTQLKAHLELDGAIPQEVVFKPKRYERSKILSKTPYEGYDRHNGEIAAFHLDRVLGFYKAPPVVGRIINLRSEILPVAKKSLFKTFWRDQSGNVCFYGKCMYCKKKESACGNGEVMEASLTLWLPHKIKLEKMRHPWQRTYRDNVKARWERDQSYCESVVKKPPYDKGPRLLDLMDAAIFDFLIGNADRHHYEFIRNEETSMVVNLDNGKSFGNPHHDELSILAPITQCCMLRRSTYIRISSFAPDLENNLSLSHILDEKLKTDPIYPVLTKDHLDALDRRLETIFTKLKGCFDKKGRQNVLL